MPTAWSSPLRALRDAPASTALCAVQVAVFAAVVWRSGWPVGVVAQVAAGGLERSHVWAGQPWRLLTAAFVHEGWLHLGANVAFGWWWCRLVEASVGAPRFLALWVAAALAGSAASLLLQDVVSTGASGALFGMIGAVLVLHRRTFAAWRGFWRSPPVVVLGVSLAVYTLVVVAGGFGADHAAHAGGFAAGTAGAWLLSASPPRRAPTLAAIGVLALACVAAAWPRPVLTAWQAATAHQAALEALRREDAVAATAAARPIEADGWRIPGARLLRARLLEARGEWDAAEPALRELLAGQDATQREVARRLLFRMGYRFYTGEGAPQDAQRAYRLIRDACAAGDAEACRAEAQIRTGLSAPPAP
jgi:membrane associated rhomboid family serine protease